MNYKVTESNKQVDSSKGRHTLRMARISLLSLNSEVSEL